MNIHLPAEPLNIPSLIGCCKKSCNALWLVIIITHITETGQPTNMYIYIYMYIYTQYIIKWDWWDRGIFDGSAIPIPKWKMAIATRSITIDQRDLAYQCWDKHVKLAKKVRMEMTQKWEWKPPLLWEFDPLNILEIPWHHEDSPKKNRVCPENSFPPGWFRSFYPLVMTNIAMVFRWP